MQVNCAARDVEGVESTSDLRRQATELHRSLHEFVKQYQFRNRNEVFCYGVTVSGCYLLQALADRGPLAMQELSANLYLKISSVTRLVDGLVKKRLVRRKRDTGDKRVVRIELTEAGRRVHRKITDDLLAREEELLQSLPEDVRQGVVEAVAMLLQEMSPAKRGTCRS